MPNQPEDQPDTSIAELFRKLVDEGADVIRAELNLYRAIALYRIERAKAGAAAIAAGLLLALAALITLLVLLAEALAIHIGPVAAGLVVAGVAGAAALLLVRAGASRMAVLWGDEEEHRTLDSGERKA